MNRSLLPLIILKVYGKHDLISHICLLLVILIVLNSIKPAQKQFDSGLLAQSYGLIHTRSASQTTNLILLLFRAKNKTKQHTLITVDDYENYNNYNKTERHLELTVKLAEAKAKANCGLALKTAVKMKNKTGLRPRGI